MRDIIVFNRVSADGYFSDENGGLDWAVPDSELDREAAERMPGAGAMLLGRKTYDIFESFWPHATDQDPHAPGRHKPEIAKMAEWINAAQKLVISSTKRQLTWNNSRLLTRFDPAEIEAIKQEPGKDIMVFGSGSLVSQLSRHRLVDEYRFVLAPLLLGKGQPMIRDMPSLRLDLKELKRYESGNVMLCYRPA